MNLNDFNSIDRDEYMQDAYDDGYKKAYYEFDEFIDGLCKSLPLKFLQKLNFHIDAEIMSRDADYIDQQNEE